jgi:transcriptional regulator
VNVPVELSQDSKSLLFHVASSDPIVSAFQSENPSCLVVFSGPHAYVSPRWYDAPNVPAWNYLSVQASGTPKVVSDAGEILESLKILVGRYESSEFTESLFSEEALAMVNQNVPGIVVVKLEIQKLEASFKLSQNRNEKSFLNIISELSKSSDPGAKAIALEMKKLNEMKKLKRSEKLV